MAKKKQHFLQPIQLTIDLHRIATLILITAVVAEFLFMILDYHINYGGITRMEALRLMFNIAREDSIASWFACTQTLLSGLTMGFIFLCIKKQPDRQKDAMGWLILTCFFLYMSFDDGSQIHERLGNTFKETLRQTGNTLDFFPSYSWQIVFLPVFVGLGLFTYYFLWHQLKEKLAHKLLFVSFICFGFAVYLDFIEGLEPSHPWNLYSFIVENTDLDIWTLSRFNVEGYETLRHFSKSIEETLEMFGHTLIWYTVLLHFPILIPSVTLNFPKVENT